MKLGFPIVMDEILKAKSTLTQVKFVNEIYKFIEWHGKNYSVSREKLLSMGLLVSVSNYIATKPLLKGTKKGQK